MNKKLVFVIFLASFVIGTEAAPAQDRRQGGLLPGRLGSLASRGTRSTTSPAGSGARRPSRNPNGGVPVPDPPGTRRAVAPATGTPANTAPLGGSAPTATGAAPAAEGGDGQAHTLNWKDAEAELVLQAYADALGKTILIDPQTPKAKITLLSQPGKTFSLEEYLEAIEVVLEMNLIHVEPYGESFVKALPRKSVRNEGIPLIMDATKTLEEKGKVVSMMIPFKYISAKEEAKEALDQFKSATGILIAFERTNTILVTDTQQNINRMLEIAHAIDKESPVLEQVFVRQIKYAGAVEVKEFLEKIVEDSVKLMEKSGKGQANVANKAQPTPFQRPGLLGRNQPQPQQPAANVSKVMSVSDADRGFIRGNVLILADERSNKLVIKSLKSNMDFFDKVIEQLDIETTPDTVVKVYRLKYADSEDVSDMINDLIGNAPSGKSSSKGSQSQTSKKGGTGGNLTSGTSTKTAARKSVNQRSGESKTGELSKDNTTVLSDERINGIVVMTEKDLVPTIEQIIESMDVKLSQVLIETMIIEVNLGDDLKTGMDWIQKGRYEKQVASTDNRGIPTYYTKRETTYKNTTTGEEKSTTSYLSDLVPSGYSKTTTTSGDGWTQTITDSASTFAGSAAKIAHDGIANYYTAGTATAIGGGQGGELMGQLAQGITSNMLGSAFNFVFSSDELGIAAILQATKTDSHAKYVASPVVMTLDNKEATINATEMHYILKGFTSSGNSYSTIAVPDYEQKELGIEIKATPKINPNGTVMLEVETKYTQLGDEEPVQYSTGTGGGLGTVQVQTTITREMSSDVLLENGQTVVFGGLVQTSTAESETGIPILKDIPWIGKWLFSTVKMSEGRTELLIFMTPYVLTDAEAAQAEALRRKKTMSDSRPWEDHGWSTSALADPVSKKEQLRRLKDEWKKQDEERQSKLAIEEAKLERAKALEKMTKTERDYWLEKHKDELEKEEKEELEKKMLDKESQDELKKLADQVRARKLKEAGKEIKEAEEKQKAENPNERDRLKGVKPADEILIENAPDKPAEKKEEPKSESKTEEPNPEAK